MLELVGIKKSYKVGDKFQHVLKGIDVKFRENEFVSILGQSGSGKTTLLNIIGGLDKYDSGDLIIEGVSTKKYRDRNWDSYRNHRVGFIFQNYNLIMHQSVLENVEIALTLSGVSKSDRKKRSIDALEKVGLKEHINKKPNQLSGGQMQRVAIARALVNDPEIILADEPTGALDSDTSVQIMDLLKEIAKDKLVIMVTHNPELAKVYSTRIIELKDGVILNDSNPLKDIKEKKSKKEMKKTSMSLKSDLQLSFNNLLTKKKRTLLTGFAGSIGIIGIALILSLSTGVNNYVKKMEKDSLADYPLTIERVKYDLFGSIIMSLDDDGNNEKCEGKKLCSKDDVIKDTYLSSDKGIAKNNNLTEFKKYIEDNSEFKEYSDKIKYDYQFDLQVYTKDYKKVNPSVLLSNSKSIFMEVDLKDENLELISGKLPANHNELLLVVGNDNKVNDTILYSLGIKDRKNITSDLVKIHKDEKYRVKSTNVSYEDIVGNEMKLILNTDYYKEKDNKFIDYSNDTDYLNQKIDDGMSIKIVGIVRNKNEGTTENYIGYTHDLTLKIIEKISKTNIYKKQIENKNINVLTGKEFDGITTTYEELTEKLGIYEIDSPSSISIYPKDFNSKQKIEKLITKYNDDKKNNNQEDLIIEYSDVMKTIVSGVTKAVTAISFILIGFVAISLIVSSIMIAIITYISVLERTKEIGILRAIGASKKDIKRVFRAETIIEGLIAGILGIFIAFLITLPINAIVSYFAKVNDIATVPIFGAIFLIALSVLLNVVAGLKPSSMAAKKDPVESLRTE